MFFWNNIFMMNLQNKSFFFRLVSLGLFFLLNKSLTFSQEYNYIINQFTVMDGLSQNEVTSITEDQDGFIWIGSRGGLNRFDGYGFKKYKPRADDSTSINYPSIEMVYADKNQNVWIGTKSMGLSIYSSITERFKNFYYNKENPNGISHQRVISFLEDQNGRIWAGTWAGGINLYNPKDNSFSHFLDNKAVKSILQTRDKKIIAACYEGLWLFNEKKSVFEPLLKEVFNDLTKIIESPDSPHIWIGCWGNVIYKYNYLNHEVKSFELPAGVGAYTFYIPEKGKLWIGTWGGGLYIMDTQEVNFKKFIFKNNLGETINPNVILDIFKDSKNNYWIGTDGQGVFKMKQQINFQQVKLQNKTIDKKNGDPKVITIFYDSNKRYWVGQIMSPLSIYDQNWNYLHSVKQYTVKPFGNLSDIEEVKPQHTTDFIYQLNDGKIWVAHNKLAEVVNINGEKCIIECANIYNNPELSSIKKVKVIKQIDSIIWIGLQQHGLVKLKYTGKELKIIEHHKSSLGVKYKLQSNRISSVLLDKEKRLWVGTYNGLYLLKDEGKFIPIQNIIQSIPSSNLILNIAEDSTGGIWFGTPAGLNHFYKNQSGEVKHEIFTEEEGLPDDYINAILADNNGNIWISNNAGLSKINIDTKKVNNYNQNQGIGVSQFSENASLAVDSVLYLGGQEGILTFTPNKVTENLTPPTVVFTDFKLFNNSVKVDEIIEGKKLLTSSINHTNEIKLPFYFNDLAFQVAALDFNTAESNRFAYKLVGRDNDWIQLGNRRWVTFNNLSPGDYELHIIGSNDNNIWSKEAKKVKISIAPPWWATIYAMALYVVIILAIVFIIRQIAINKERLIKNIELLNLENAKKQELNELRLKLFTNVSHEFKTPLSLIIAPIQEMIDNYEEYDISEKLLSRLKVIGRNTKRLMRLVSQLIDFRKVQTGNISLKIKKYNLENYFFELIAPFKELAEINNIKFLTKYKYNEPTIYFDKEKIDSVLNNLLSNAFKYVSENGCVTLSVKDDKEFFYFEVIDNGEGIPEEHQAFIFDRYYQVDNSEKKYSSGIGLTLAKQFVEMHNGEISVESEPQKGTKFIVKLKKEETISGEEFATDFKLQAHIPLVDSTFKTPKIVKAKRNATFPSKKNRLVIVENDIEMLNFVESILGNRYEIFRAYNGEDGFNLILDKEPDLIISDIMMPKIDGFELCKMLKEHKYLCFIPIILFTGKDSEQFQLFGSKMGADLYMTKPFNPELLKNNIENLLLTRLELKKHFTKKVKLEPKDIEITSYDEQILNKAIKIIESNLDNPKLNADFLSKKLALSQSSLYKKLKSLTGNSISQFIRSIRIKRAAQLLQDSHKTISEIAYEVGIYDLKYFRSNFVKEFGITPSEYRKKNL